MSLRTVSFVVLALLGGLVLLGSLASAGLAYRGDFPIAGVSIADVAAGREAVLLGLRGARGTAAAWSAAWAAGTGTPLVLLVVALVALLLDVRRLTAPR